MTFIEIIWLSGMLATTDYSWIDQAPGNAKGKAQLRACFVAQEAACAKLVGGRYEFEFRFREPPRKTNRRQHGEVVFDRGCWSITVRTDPDDAGRLPFSLGERALSRPEFWASYGHGPRGNAGVVVRDPVSADMKDSGEFSVDSKVNPNAVLHLPRVLEAVFLRDMAQLRTSSVAFEQGDLIWTWTRSGGGIAESRTRFSRKDDWMPTEIVNFSGIDTQRKEAFRLAMEYARVGDAIHLARQRSFGATADSPDQAVELAELRISNFRLETSHAKEVSLEGFLASLPNGTLGADRRGGDWKTFSVANGRKVETPYLPPDSKDKWAEVLKQMNGVPQLPSRRPSNWTVAAWGLLALAAAAAATWAWRRTGSGGNRGNAP